MPIKYGKKGPNISHLLFVDNILLFGTTSKDQAACMLECLRLFYVVFEKKINSQKTKIYFSKKVLAKTKEDILNSTGFTETMSIGKYLGMNLLNKK